MRCSKVKPPTCRGAQKGTVHDEIDLDEDAYIGQAALPKDQVRHSPHFRAAWPGCGSRGLLPGPTSRIHQVRGGVERRFPSAGREFALEAG